MEIKKFLCLLIPELSNKYFLFKGSLFGSLLRKSIPGIFSDYIFKLNSNNTNENNDKQDYTLFDKEKEEKFFDIVMQYII